MRNNGPVSGREVNYSADLNILSVTDAKGHITYCNDDFVKLSGFTMSELQGQPHNVVRHPDMPSLAFEDLWNHLKAKKSWMGMVKNRCKNGDHYWVDAFATPISENDQLVECQSVRFKPKQEWVKRAESLYQKINSGKSLPVNVLKVPLVLKTAMISLGSFLPISLGVFEEVSPMTNFLLCGVGGLINFAAYQFCFSPLRAILAKSRQIASNKIAQYVYTGRMDEFGEIELAMKMQGSELAALVGRMADDTKNQASNSQKTLFNVQQSTAAAQLQSDEATQMAAGLEEMSASMKEISHNASDASNVAANAVSTADVANQAMSKLNEYGMAIGNVIQLINSIAEQTNLLALNATIEAARAGEAGKGFAVVANEVKDLASQTAKATEDVDTKVKAIQGATEGAMQAMTEISEVINKINHYQTSIAAAVEEQSAVTNEITRNITTINSKALETTEALRETEGLSLNLSRDVSVSQRLSCEFRKKIQTRTLNM